MLGVAETVPGAYPARGIECWAVKAFSANFGGKTDGMKAGMSCDGCGRFRRSEPKGGSKEKTGGKEGGVSYCDAIKYQRLLFFA
jgi:hypothetical protein